MYRNANSNFDFLGRFSRYLAFFATIGAVLAGCNEESGDHNMVTPNVVAETASDDLCVEIAKVMCYNLFECCTGQQIEQTLGIEITTEESDCRHDIELICREDLSYVLWAVGQGTASIDAEQTNECLQSLLVGEEGCFPFILGHPAYETACGEPAIRGKQDEGGSCLADLECREYMYCTANRKCKSLPEAGEICTPDSGCVGGYFCGPDETGNYVCREYREKGQTCSNGFPMALCAPSLYCEFPDEYEDEGVCKDQKAVGEACANDMPCLDSVCLSGNCSNGDQCYEDGDCEGTCENSEDSCTDDADCGGICEDSFDYCDEDSDCGGTCDISGDECNDDWDCHEDGYCEETEEYCNGEWDCTDEGHCAESGDYCNEDYGCEEDEECIPTEECIPNDDDSCDFDNCDMEECVGASNCNGRICAEWYDVVDYCELGLGAINFFDESDDDDDDYYDDDDDDTY